MVVALPRSSTGRGLKGSLSVIVKIRLGRGTSAFRSFVGIGNVSYSRSWRNFLLLHWTVCNAFLLAIDLLRNVRHVWNGPRILKDFASSRYARTPMTSNMRVWRSSELTRKNMSSHNESVGMSQCSKIFCPLGARCPSISPLETIGCGVLTRSVKVG